MTIDRGRFENLESDHQYESNLESDVRFEIESNNEASQVPRLYTSQYVSISHTVLNWMQQNQNLIADIWVLLPCPHPRVGRHWLTVFVLLTGDRQVFNLAPFTDKHFRIRGLGDTIKDLHNLLFLYPDIPKARTFSKFWTQGWPVLFFDHDVSLHMCGALKSVVGEGQQQPFCGQFSGTTWWVSVKISRHVILLGCLLKQYSRPCYYWPFDPQCFHMGTAIKHHVADWAKLSFVIFDIRTLWRSGLSVSECPHVKNYKWWLNPVWHRLLYSCTHVAIVGAKGLKLTDIWWHYCR